MEVTPSDVGQERPAGVAPVAANLAPTVTNRSGAKLSDGSEPVLADSPTSGPESI